MATSNKCVLHLCDDEAVVKLQFTTNKWLVKPKQPLCEKCANFVLDSHEDGAGFLPSASPIIELLPKNFFIEKWDLFVHVSNMDETAIISCEISQSNNFFKIMRNFVKVLAKD